MTQVIVKKDNGMTFAEEVALGAYLFRLEAASKEVLSQVFKRAEKLLDTRTDEDKTANKPVPVTIYGPERIYLSILADAERDGIVLKDSVDCRNQGMLLEAQKV